MRYLSRLYILLFITSIFCGDQTQQVESVQYKKLPIIGDNEFTSLNGNSVSFNDLYKDGPILVSFWFLGCGPCVAEMKHLSKLNEKYKDTGFKVISICTDTKSKGRVKNFVKKKKYSFDMLFDLNGKNGLLKKLGSNSCPFTAMINEDGTIFSKHMGYEKGDEVMIENEIKALISYNKTINEEESEKEESKVE